MKVGRVRRPGVAARLRWVVAAVLLAASTLVGLSGPPAGAWSSDDGAVAVFGGTNTNSASSVAVDSSGNVYTTGRFMATVDFDPGAGTEELTAVATHDIFVSCLLYTSDAADE